MMDGDDQEQFDRRFARVRAARDAFLKELNRDPTVPFRVITDNVNPMPLGEDTALEVRFVIQPNPAVVVTDFRGTHPHPVRPPPEPVILCKNCGTELDHSVRFCPSCGDIYSG